MTNCRTMLFCVLPLPTLNNSVRKRRFTLCFGVEKVSFSPFQHNFYVLDTYLSETEQQCLHVAMFEYRDQT